MSPAPETSGLTLVSGAPESPAPAAPARVAGTVRRTSHVDMHWDLPPDSEPFAPTSLHLRAFARDARTGDTGAIVRLGEARVDARVDGEGKLSRITAHPATGDADALLGARVGSGFRRRTEKAFPDERGTPLGLLLDDLPVAALIAGYARVRRAMAGGTLPSNLTPMASAKDREDLCSGWRAGGTMINSILSGEGLPYRRGPVAPEPAPGDPDGWHEETALPPGAMRRRRRIDLQPGATPDAPPRINAMFRDTWMDLQGREEVLHEYLVHASLTRDRKRIETISADPRVLPFGECPAAGNFVHKLVDAEVVQLRRTVRESLVSTESCTHLNDLLRALGDVTYLLGHLDTG